MDFHSAHDWLELAQDGDVDRALDRLASVGPTEAARDLRLHLQLQALALAPLGVLAPDLPAPRMAIDWSAIERRWNALTATESEMLRDAAETAAREVRHADCRAHSNFQSAIGAEADDLRVHLQLQELALAEAHEAVPAVAGAKPAPRLTIDWQAIARRSREMMPAHQQDLRDAALQAMSELRTAPTVVPVARRRAPVLRLSWRVAAAAAAMFLAGVGLYQLASVQPPTAPRGPAQVARHSPPPVRTTPPPAAQTQDGVPVEPGASSQRSPAPAQPVDDGGFIRLPLGTLAAVEGDGRIEVEPETKSVERLTQTTGKVRYVLGAMPTEVTLPIGQVTGSEAEVSIELAGDEHSLTSVTVSRGEVLLLDGTRIQYTVRAGETGYLSPRGSIRVVASREPAPEFPLPMPEPAGVQPFHPEMPTVADVLLERPALDRPRLLTLPPVETGTLTLAATAATPPALPPSTPPVLPPVSTPPSAGTWAASVPPVDVNPADEVPPSDFTPGHGPGGASASIALPPTPEPGGPGKSHAGGKGNGNGGNGHGFGGSGNAGLHLGPGSGAAGGNPGGAGSGNGNGNSNAGGGKGKSK